MDRVLVMSIKPQFAARIFSGEKNVELRRVRPHVGSGDLVVVYASAPTMALVGAFVVDSVVSDTVRTLWTRYPAALGVTRSEFCEYFEGAQLAHGLVVGRRVRLPLTPLHELRGNGFRPPQSYLYWRRPLNQLMPPNACALVADLVANLAAAE